jgi:hypothetical protein
LIVAGSVAVPLVDWDAFAIWGLKAKVLAHEALRPCPVYFQDLTLSYSHLDYPLMLPFLTAGGYAAMATVDDQTGKLISAFLDVMVVPVVYLGLRWKLSWLPAAGLCAIMVLLPAFSRFGGGGCADLPLATFYAGSILYLARWLDGQDRSDLILAILFSTFTAFTKNEGLVLALINGLVLVFFAVGFPKRQFWKGVIFFYAGFLMIEAVWLGWSHSLPHTHENYGSRLLSSQLLASLPQVIPILEMMALQATDPKAWGWLAGMTLLLALLGWRAFFRRPVQALWILLALQLAVYATVYSVSPWNLTLLLSSSLDRLLWHTIPAVILLAGWHWAEINAPAVPKPAPP